MILESSFHMWTCSFCYPQVLWGGRICICIPPSLLPAAAVNPHQLITCLCIQSNEDPECWEPLELLNSGEKLSFHTHPELKILSVLDDFLTATKETRWSPTGLEWRCTSCFSIASKRWGEHLPSCWVRPLCYQISNSSGHVFEPLISIPLSSNVFCYFP